MKIIAERWLLVGVFCLLSSTLAFGGKTDPSSENAWAARTVASSEYARYRAKNPDATKEQLRGKHDKLFVEADRISGEEQKKILQNYLDAVVIGSSPPSHNHKVRFASKAPVAPLAPALVRAAPPRALERESKRDVRDDEPIDAGGAAEVTFVDKAAQSERGRKPAAAARSRGD